MGVSYILLLCRSLCERVSHDRSANIIFNNRNLNLSFRSLASWCFDENGSIPREISDDSLQLIFDRKMFF